MIAAARPVALAKPIWITMRNRDMIARTMIVVEFSSPKPTTISLAIQVAALVESKAVPSEIPTPNKSTVPQFTLCTTSFQLITPILGSSSKVTATIVVVDVSIGCSFFSVVQKISRKMEITSSFISSTLTLPISFSSLATVSLPPLISSISGGIRCIISLYRQMDISSENGAAATNQSSHEISTPSWLLIKFTATIFCAAAVLMPTFQTLST